MVAEMTLTSAKETMMPGLPPYPDVRTEGRSSERGIALILAILALLLLTFLGLTLTTTTSTEVQIANNFKWSQQALYNAEAGLEFAKQRIAAATAPIVLPAPRIGGSWNPMQAAPTGVLPPPPFGGGSRNFENGGCDKQGNGVGYGVVLHDGTAQAPYQNMTLLYGAPIPGAVTIWIRHKVRSQGQIAGYFAADDTSTTSFIVTVEGVAPSLQSPNRAIRVIESEINVTPTTGSCDDLDVSNQASQTGFFSKCAPAP
jgi:hypothetical protein